MRARGSLARAGTLVHDTVTRDATLRDALEAVLTDNAGRVAVTGRRGEYTGVVDMETLMNSVHELLEADRLDAMEHQHDLEGTTGLADARGAGGWRGRHARGRRRRGAEGVRAPEVEGRPVRAGGRGRRPRRPGDHRAPPPRHIGWQKLTVLPAALVAVLLATWLWFQQADLDALSGTRCRAARSRRPCGSTSNSPRSPRSSC